MQEEEKYIEIRKKLLAMPKIKASDDFVTKLQHKINLVDAEESKAATLSKIDDKVSFFERLTSFGFKKYIPAMSFGIVIIFISLIGYVAIHNRNSDLPKEITGIPESKVTDTPVNPLSQEQKNNNLSQLTLPPQEVNSETSKEELKKESLEELKKNEERTKADFEPKIEYKAEQNPLPISPPKADVPKGYISQPDLKVEEKNESGKSIDIQDERSVKAKKPAENKKDKEQPVKESTVKDKIDNIYKDTGKSTKTYRDTVTKSKQKIENNENK